MSSIKCEKSSRMCGEDSVSCASGEGSQCLGGRCQSGTNCWDFSNQTQMQTGIQACRASCGSVGSGHACTGKTYTAAETGNLGHSVTCCDDANGSGDNVACSGALMDNDFCEQQSDDMPVCHAETSAHHRRKQGGNFGGQGGNNGKPPVKPPQKPLGPGGTPPVTVNTLSTWNKALGIGSVVVAALLFAILASRGKKGLVGAVIVLLVFIALGCLFFFNVIKINEKFGYETLPKNCTDAACETQCGSSGARCRPGACRMMTGNDCCLDANGSKCGGSAPTCADRAPGYCNKCDHGAYGPATKCIDGKCPSDPECDGNSSLPCPGIGLTCADGSTCVENNFCH